MLKVAGVVAARLTVNSEKYKIDLVFINIYGEFHP